MPEPSSIGGMKAISKMYYDLKIFKRPEYIHFDSTFAGASKIYRLLHSFLHKFRFILLLLNTKPKGVFIYTSSYWGFYDKAFYALLSRLFGVKSVLNIVGGEFFKFYQSHFYHKWLVRLCMKFPSKVVIGSSSWLYPFLQEFPKVKSVVIHNPVVCRNVVNPTKMVNERVRFLFFGRLVIEKGIEEIIQVLKKMQANPDLQFHFTFAGKGPMGSHIKSVLVDMIEAGFVTLIENVSDEDKNILLQSSHVFVLPSHAEVLPISLIEAMECNMPAIITNVGGMKDAVDDNINGFIIYDLDNTIEELEKKMKYLIYHPDKIYSMGKLARVKIHENFKFSVIFNKKIELFSDLS